LLENTIPDSVNVRCTEFMFNLSFLSVN